MNAWKDSTMAEVTAGMVKELREKTDAPMMECKKALAEAQGNMARAEEILRVKLGNKAAKASTRVEAERIALIGKIGENISIRRFARLQAVGRLLSYVHGGSKIGVLVDLTGGDDTLGKDLAMHIAAGKPRSLRADGVPAEDIARERSIAQQKGATVNAFALFVVGEGIEKRPDDFAAEVAAAARR